MGYLDSEIFPLKHRTKRYYARLLLHPPPTCEVVVEVKELAQSQ